jgi:hypothetical protein
VTTNQDKPTGPLIEDAHAAVKIACDALTTDDADAPVAILAGLLFVGTRVAGAIASVGALLDRRLAECSAAHVRALHDYAHTIAATVSAPSAAAAADSDDPDGSERPH